MNYYIHEAQLNSDDQKMAAVKARDDVEAILKDEGMQALDIVFKLGDRENGSMSQKLKGHLDAYHLWQEELKKLKSGDTLYIQFPVLCHTLLFAKLVKSLEKKGVKVVAIIHDLEILRWSRLSNNSFKFKIRTGLEEKSVLKACSKIIVHNSKMQAYLAELGIGKNKMALLEIFDYLIPDYDEDKMNQRDQQREEAVLIAGNLRKHKAGYAYELPDNYSFHLFGVGYDGETNEKVLYKGSFLPDELPYVLDGSFGLIWDGESADTCQGIYGEYLRYNNPHKTSLYLASNIPVIIWKEAALADFVLENKCGITVDSLWDIEKEVSKLSEEDYCLLQDGARKVGEKLRKGHFLREAVKKA